MTENNPTITTYPDEEDRRDRVAELQVLGCCLADPVAFGSIADLLRPGDFDLPENRAVFKAMKRLDEIGRATTRHEVRAQLEQDEEHLPLGGLARHGLGYLGTLEQAAPLPITPEKVMAAAREVLRANKARKDAANARGIPLPAAEARPDFPRPKITISTEIRDVVDGGERAILANHAIGIYQRSGVLVRVHKDDGTDRAWLQRQPNAPTIGVVRAEALTETLSSAATWTVLRRDRKTRTTAEVEVMPPQWVAKTLLQRSSWRFPHLIGIVTSPTLRGDGTILDAPGYDPATGLYYDPVGVTFPRIPDRPTREDAQAALAELSEPYREFCFKADEAGDGADLSAGMSLPLTLLARHAIPGSVPALAARGNAPGTGKGLIVNVGAVIATGRKAPVMNLTRDPSEARKRFFTLAMEGAPIVNIDNVSGGFGDDATAAVLTAETLKDRVLGVNESRTVPNRTLYAVTGNGVQFVGDCARRIVLVDLETSEEFAEDRKFQRSDLLRWVAENRPRLVVAGLTILRAYFQAGQPAHGLSPYGSFEDWDTVVRGAMLYAGAADPLATRRRVRDEGDGDREALKAFFGAWEARYGIGPANTKVISEVLADASMKDNRDAAEWLEILGGICKGDRVTGQRLGAAFRHHERRVVAGYRLVKSSARVARGGRAVWYVDCLAKA